MKREQAVREQQLASQAEVNDNLQDSISVLREKVHASLRRQHMRDAATLDAIAHALPAAMSTLEERWEQRFATLRVLIESRLPSVHPDAVHSRDVGDPELVAPRQPQGQSALSC